MVLEVTRLHAGYGDGPDVLVDATLDVGAGEVVALLGASGSGKSTLLRCVAGLHPVRRGRIAIAGHDVAGVHVERRSVGLVFQDHALFPHRDVTGNVAFGPRMQGVDPEETAARVMRALEGVGLAHLSARAVDELSGGEQQRVALARALAAHPRLLLLDEPYGSLDRPLRERLAAELPGLVRGEGIGALLVTHDQQEALRAADRIAVMVDGTVRQLDVPERLWRDPVDAAVATFLGVGPLVDAEVSGGTARGAFGTLPIAGVVDGRVALLVPHAALRVAPEAAGEDGGTPERWASLSARVIERRFAGDHHRVEARLDGDARVTVRVDDPAGIPGPGATLTLRVDPSALRAFPAGAASEQSADVAQ